MCDDEAGVNPFGFALAREMNEIAAGG